MVIMQLAKLVHVKSVGEKASPLPLLSIGASVIIFNPEATCVASVLKLPRYFTVDVVIILKTKRLLIRIFELYMKRVFFSFFIIANLIVTKGFGQNAVLGENSTIYRNEYKIGAQLNSFGWALSGILGEYQGVKNRVQIGLDFAMLKHPKEIKSFNPYYEDAKGYFYGKMNSIMLLRPLLGVERLLSEKYRKSGVQISYNFHVGPSFALVKPVYLEIGLPKFPYEFIEIQQYNPEIHAIDDIYGRASFFNGFDKMKLQYGLHAKFGLNFEYSNVSDGIKGITVGAIIDAFSKELPIMAFSDNKQIFAGFYIGLFYGKKYVR
jgi:hypothetical protein